MLVESLSDWSGLELYLHNGDNACFLPYFQFTGGDAGDDIKVYDHKSGIPAVSSGAKIGTWATIRLEYYPELERYDLYVDGDYVLSGSYLRYGTVYPSVEEIDNVVIALANQNVGEFYFDNRVRLFCFTNVNNCF